MPKTGVVFKEHKHIRVELFPGRKVLAISLSPVTIQASTTEESLKIIRSRNTSKRHTVFHGEKLLRNITAHNCQISLTENVSGFRLLFRAPAYPQHCRAVKEHRLWSQDGSVFWLPCANCITQTTYSGFPCLPSSDGQRGS